MALFKTLFGNDADLLYERNFQILLLANILPPLGIALISPILSSLIDPLQTTSANIGLLISFYTAPPIVMIPVVGFLSDRYGRRPILVSGLLCFGLAGAAIALTTDFRVALALRLVQGVAYGGLTPIIITSMGDIYEGTREATAQGIRFTSSGLTQVIFPLLASVLVVVGWNYPFLIYLLAIPIAIIVYLWFDEPMVQEDDGTSNPDNPNQTSALVNLVRQRHVYAFLLARGFPMVVWIGFITYNSLIVVRVYDGTSTQAGFLIAFTSLAYSLTASQAGRIADIFENRLFLLVGSNSCLGLGFVVFLFAPGLIVAGVGVILIGTGFGLTLAIYRTLVTGLAGKSLRGSLVSLSEAFGRLISTITPIFIGWGIGYLSPQLGMASAVQFAGLGAALLGSAASILCLLIVIDSQPV